MSARLATIAPRLEKLLLMLSSDRPGEVVNAAAAIGRTLQSAGADWHDLASAVRAPAGSQADDGNPVEADVRMMVAYCLQRPHALGARELKFLQSLRSWRGRLTEKQSDWLCGIYARVWVEAA